MDAFSLTTVATSLALAKEGISAALGIREFNAVAPKLAEINGQLLQAQEGLFVYTAKMADLQNDLLRAREELAALRKKADERERYELFAIPNGGLVYRFKGGNGAEQPPHHLCQPCLDVRGQKVVLQLGYTHWQCHECKTSIPAGDEGKNPLYVR